MQTPRVDDDNYSISVIVPVYNAGKFILEALQSIADQTYSDFEAIIIDDGSTDRSAEIIEAFCQNDKRFRLYRRSNEGVVAARNFGVSQARGNWIALCDADDFWAKNKLERQIAFIEANKNRFSEPLVCVGTPAYQINKKGKVVGKIHFDLQSEEEFIKRRKKYAPIFMLTSSVMFRKDIFDKVGGFRSEYEVTQDIDLFTRMAVFGICLNTPEILTYYRMHGESASDKKFIRQKLNHLLISENAKRRANHEPELNYDEFHNLLTKNPANFDQTVRTIKSNFFYRQGGIALVNGQYLRGSFFIVQSFLLNRNNGFKKINTYIQKMILKNSPLML